MTDTCKLCGGKPTRRQYRYYDGDNKGAVVELCPHEYNVRWDSGDDLVLVRHQDVPTPKWFVGHATA
jgi:hypothetical protein